MPALNFAAQFADAVRYFEGLREQANKSQAEE